MLVTRQNFDDIIKTLKNPAPRAIDTETTGLMWYRHDKLFSISIADAIDDYYFNFLSYDNTLDENLVLPREWLEKFKPVFLNEDNLWFGHNFKFDLHMLKKEGLELKGILHCTQAIARVEHNTHLKYSLEECAKRIGLEKDATVENYIDEHKMYDWETVPGKKGRNKLKFFHMIPFDVMSKYAQQDARVTYQLGMYQIESITSFSKKVPMHLNTPLNVMDNEREFTKTCFDIEERGVLIDKKYCEEAAAFETKNMEKASEEFFKLTGVKFVNSAKVLAPIFKSYGEEFEKTEKGNDRFDKNALDSFKSPVAKIVKDYRKAEKRAGYFYSYIYYADDRGLIHANIKQDGTETGRISYGSPNLQNVPKRGEDDSAYPVRRAIIPHPSYILFMLDYDAMEYRLMADYANQKDLSEKILGGMDIHVACQELMGLKDRNTAKTMNFLKLYGGGAQKLADSLGITLMEARLLSNKYWNNLPKVAELMSDIVYKAEVRGYVVNWFGRICNFPKKDFAYKAPNHFIQGGCADVVKCAMNNIKLLLADKKSRMIIQVHDELVFEIHENELYLVNEIKHIMEKTYPPKRLGLTCSVEYSTKSWFDKMEWLGVLGDGKKAGNEVQG